MFLDLPLCLPEMLDMLQWVTRRAEVQCSVGMYCTRSRAGGRGLTVHATVRRRGEVMESELSSANESLHVAAAAVIVRGLLASHLTAQTPVTSPQ